MLPFVIHHGHHSWNKMIESILFHSCLASLGRTKVFPTKWQCFRFMDTFSLMYKVLYVQIWFRNPTSSGVLKAGRGTEAKNIVQALFMFLHEHFSCSYMESTASLGKASGVIPFASICGHMSNTLYSQFYHLWFGAFEYTTFALTARKGRNDFSGPDFWV